MQPVKQLRDVPSRALLAAMAILWTLAAPRSDAQAPLAGYTPEALQPGAPAGSYALSGFEHIQPYSGSFSFVLPLLQVGGRGAAGTVITLPIERKWRVGYGNATEANKPKSEWWSEMKPGYGPGIVQVRTAADRGCQGYTGPYVAITRITFTQSDGTEVELRDVLAQGQPKQSFCVGTRFDRGTQFVSADGSAMTFVSTSSIVDYPGTGPFRVFRPTGFLMLRDGTRYDVQDGVVSSIRDRNGNVVSFWYDDPSPFNANPRLVLIQDSLNRQISVTYETPEDPKDVIAFKGFGGADREIWVFHDDLENALAQPTYGIQTFKALFPGLDGSDQDFFNPRIVSAVELPNQRAYYFEYNPHGELERVTLPTGGQFEYLYDAGFTAGGLDDRGSFFLNMPGFSGMGIYRRLVERSMWSAGGEFVSNTTYSRPETISGSPTTPTASSLGFVQETTFGPPYEAQVPLRRDVHYYYGMAITSLVSPPVAYPAWKNGREWRTAVIDEPTAVQLKLTDHSWQQRGNGSLPSWWTGAPDAAPQVDPRVVSTQTTLDGGSWSFATYDYDNYNNRTAEREWAFGVAPGGGNVPVRKKTTSYVTTYATSSGSFAYDTDVNIHIRSLPLVEQIYDGEATLKASTTYEYDRYQSDLNHFPLVDRALASGRASGFGTGYTPRGNVTGVQRLWAGGEPGASYVWTYAGYDVLGNVVWSQDANGNATSYVFDDNFGAPDNEAQANTQPAELGTLHAWALPSQATNALSHTTYIQYDYYLGRPVNGEDPNGTISSIAYDDSLDRPTERILARTPANSSNLVRTKTVFAYDDVARIVTTTQDRSGFGALDLKSDARFDGFGRAIRTRLFETGTAFIATTKDYDALGRVAWTSNPYRPGTETPQYTDFSYDALGRPTTVVTPDTAVAETTYAGNLTTTIDQAQKKRTAASDALGRVLNLVEDPDGLNFSTSYTYDVFDQLTGVAQGSQSRTFTYDSLARLYQATNPESGTTTYTYFPGGELKTRTDAANSVTTYTYDGLNRVKTKVYSGGPATPNVTYTYDDDAVQESKGRLTKTQSSASTSQVLSYDQLGRVLHSSQTTGSRTYPFEYTYDRAGNLATEKYPSDRVVTVTYDLAARPTQVADATTAFASSATYASHGAVADFQLGNSLYEHASYNSRLQPHQMGLGLTAVSDVFRLTYGYGESANNGNVLSQDIRHTVNSASTTWSQTYSYDGLNRLKTTTETAIAGGAQWSQTNSFDRYGNRWISASSLPLPSLTPTAQGDFNAATNRLTGGLNQYGVPGNHTRDKLGRQMVYDAENRMVQFTDESLVSTYSYDADGRRVHANVDGAGTTYVYDAFGRLAGEYGRASANPVAGAQYLMRDHLGSVRVVTGPTGAVLARHDYFVFGDEIDSSVNGRGTLYTPTDNLRQRFTGQLRDSESGLDYFGARYYGAKAGRFTAIDPVYTWQENIVDPQRWNRYAHTRNNPLRYVDPDGREITYASPQIQDFFDFLSARSEAVRGTLARYAGPNNPNLTIGQGELGRDATDGEVGGLFRPSFDPTTDSPPGSGNFERLAGMSETDMKTGLANGSLYTGATLKSATLDLDASLDLNKKDQRTIGVALHELGHADTAARDPLRHLRLSIPINQIERGKRQVHDKRQIEQDANQYRDRVLRDFPK